MPKKNSKKKDEGPVLRVRVKNDFLKEVNDYIEAANQGKTANLIGRSHLVREAVVEFIGKHKPATP